MKIVVLGSGQDAGVPQAGCACPSCARARKQDRFRRRGPAIALIDQRSAACYLIDASPDFKEQFASLEKEVSRSKKIRLRGIFLTHAHAGHYIGLWHLGKEAMDQKRVPVFATPRMRRFLMRNAPFSQLHARANIVIRSIRPGTALDLSGFSIMPFAVPHRNEFSDTVGYEIKRKRTLIYLPDIDRWTPRILRRIRAADVSLLDGTFYSPSELPRFREVPHPPIRKTVALMEPVTSKIYFTHINHTNAVNRSGHELADLTRRGFDVACDGLTFEI